MLDDHERLTNIKRKIFQRLAEDGNRRMNPRLTEEQILAFERDHLVGERLPEGYRLFLMEVGNGGFGPGSAPTLAGWDVIGMEMLPVEGAVSEEWLGEESGGTIPSHPWKPFPLTEGQTADAVDDGPDGVLTDGHLILCSWGGGGVTALIVTGPERGHVWYMDQTEGSAWPETYAGGTRLDFLGWYDLWLDGRDEWEEMNEILEGSDEG